MSKLLPPNATKLEKNIEQLGEKISSLPVPFVDLHRIDRCPVTHLPWLAWQHRVEYWQPEWSEPEKRNAIRESESFNAQRGTRSSITSLLSTVVANFQLKAWHEFQPPQQPFTFVVMISTQHLLSIEQLLQVQTAIDATKSARDNYSISAKVKTDCDFYITGSITAGTKVYLSTYTDPFFWIVDSFIQFNSTGTATFTAISSDGFNNYSSYANLDLTAAIVRSLHDIDMQQWQAVKDAANELTGVTDWVLDPANNQIKYKLPSDPTGAYLYNKPSSGYGGPFIYTLSQAQSMVCQTVNSISTPNYKLTNCNITGFNTSNPAKPIFYFTFDQINSDGSEERGKSSYYDSYGRAVAETPEEEEKTIPLETVAQKVISNASSSNQAISLLAEAYLENVAKSIFAADESKQFVRMADLIEKFELNKILAN